MAARRKRRTRRTVGATPRRVRGAASARERAEQKRWKQWSKRLFKQADVVQADAERFPEDQIGRLLGEAADMIRRAAAQCDVNSTTRVSIGADWAPRFQRANPNACCGACRGGECCGACACC